MEPGSAWRPTLARRPLGAGVPPPHYPLRCSSYSNTFGAYAVVIIEDGVVRSVYGSKWGHDSVSGAANPVDRSDFGRLAAADGVIWIPRAAVGGESADSPPTAARGIQVTPSAAANRPKSLRSTGFAAPDTESWPLFEP